MNQFIKRTKTSNFTMISNSIFKDKRLSFQAIGFLCNVLSLPDNWHFSINGLAAIHSNSGRRVVESCLFELEWFGYFQRVYQRKSNGQFDTPDYIFYDESQKPNFNDPLPAFKDRDKNTASKPVFSPDVHSVHAVESTEKSTFSPDVHSAHAACAHAACAQQYNTIKIKDSNNISYQSIVDDGADDVIDMIHTLIDYDNLILANTDKIGIIDDLVNAVKNIYTAKGDSFQIGKNTYSLAVVRAHFQKLNAAIIQYTLACLDKAHKMTTPAAYLITCLFNNINTCNVYTYNKDSVENKPAVSPDRTDTTRSKNKFNAFPQRSYDYDALERMLLENGSENANFAH